MSRNIVVGFTKNELEGFLEDKNSCVLLQKSFYNLALFPYHLSNITSSIKELLNAGVAKYDQKFDGILLGYKNVRLLTPLGTIVTDSCYIHLNIEADFYVFKPEVGATLTGIVNKISKDHVGCLVHRVFNVSVPNKSEDASWPGYNVHIGETVLLQVTYINLDARLPYIRTSFISTNAKKSKKNRNKLNITDEAVEEIPEFKLNKKETNISAISNDANINENVKIRKKKSKNKSVDEEEINNEINNATSTNIGSATKDRSQKKIKRNSSLNISTEIQETHNTKIHKEVKTINKNNFSGSETTISSDNVKTPKKKSKNKSVDEEEINNEINNARSTNLDYAIKDRSQKKNKRNSSLNISTELQETPNKKNHKEVKTINKNNFSISEITINSDNVKSPKKKSKNKSVYEEEITKVPNSNLDSAITYKSHNKNKLNSSINISTEETSNKKAKKMNKKDINILERNIDERSSNESVKSPKKKSKNKSVDEERFNNQINNTINKDLNFAIIDKTQKKNKRKSSLNSSTELRETPNKEAKIINKKEVNISEANIDVNIKSESGKKSKNKSTKEINISPNIKLDASKDKSHKKNRRKSSLIELQETFNTIRNDKEETDKSNKKKHIDLESLRDSLLKQQLDNLYQTETAKNSKNKIRKSIEQQKNFPELNETPIITAADRKSRKRKSSYSENMCEQNLELRNSYADTTIDGSTKSKKFKNKSKRHSLDISVENRNENELSITEKSNKKRKHSSLDTEDIQKKKKRKISETETQNEPVNLDYSVSFKKKRKSKKNNHGIEIDI